MPISPADIKAALHYAMRQERSNIGQVGIMNPNDASFNVRDFKESLQGKGSESEVEDLGTKLDLMDNKINGGYFLPSTKLTDGYYDFLTQKLYDKDIAPKAASQAQDTAKETKKYFDFFIGKMNDEVKTINGKPSGIRADSSDVFERSLLSMAGVGATPGYPKEVRTSYDSSKLDTAYMDIKGISSKDAAKLVDFLNGYGADTAKDIGSFTDKDNVQWGHRIELKLSTISIQVLPDFKDFLNQMGDPQSKNYNPALIKFFQKQSAEQ